MTEQTSITESRESTWSRINQSRTFSELFDRIPEALLQKASLLFLALWVFAPFSVMICNLFYWSSLPWIISLNVAGVGGLLIGIVLFGKSINIAKQENTSLRLYLYQNALPFFLFLTLMWSVLSGLFSGMKANDLLFGDFYRQEGLVAYFAYGGIFCCGLTLRDKRYIRILLQLFIAVGAINAVLVAMNSPSVNFFFSLCSHASVFYNTNHYGYYVCCTLMCAAVLFIDKDKSRIMNAFYAANIALMAYALSENSSFGPFLAVASGLVGATVLFFLYRKYFRKGNVKRVLAVVLLFAAFTVFSNLKGGQLFDDLRILADDVQNIAMEEDAAAKAGSGRWELWTAGVEFALEKPLFGFGPDNLRTKYHDLGYRHDRPHNEWIQFAASLGFPALLFYLAGLAFHLKRFLKSAKRLPVLGLGIFCVVGAYLVNSLFGNTMYYTYPYFIMILGISAGILRVDELHE